MRQLLFKLAVLAGWSGWLIASGRQPSTWVWQLVAGLVTWYGFSLLLERRGLRGTGVSLALALADAVALLAICMSVQALPLASAVIGLTPLLAFSGRKFDGVAWSPLWLALPLAAANIERIPMAWPIIGQAVLAGLLCVGCGVVVNRRLAPEPSAKESVPAMDEPEEAVTLNLSSFAGFAAVAIEQPITPATPLPASAAPTPHLANLLMESPRSWQGAAEALCQFAGASGLTLFTFSPQRSAYSVAAHSGDVPYRMRTEELTVRPGVSDVRLRAEALATLREPEEVTPMNLITLRNGGQTHALIWFANANEAELDEATERLELNSSLISRFLQSIRRDESTSMRLLELETAYRVATVTQGAETPRILMARAARDLFASFPVDHLSITALQDGEAWTIARHGVPCKLLAKTSWNRVSNFDGWAAAGFPETIIQNTHDTPQIESKEAIAERLGSFAIWRIGQGETPIGFLTVACHRKGAFTSEVLNGLRRACTEISWAATRLDPSASLSTGMVDHEEFQQRIVQGGGVLVVVRAEAEPDGPELSTTESLTVMSRIAHLLRSALPTHAAITWREHDVLAFLPGFSNEVARSWANQALEVVQLHEGARRGTQEPRLVFSSSVTPLGEQQGARVPTGTEAIPA